MRVEPNHLYFLNDNHFKKYKQYKLFTDYDDKSKGSRPHYVCLKKENVCWVIPLSTKIPKYKDLYNKEISKYGKSIKYHFIKLGKKESVLLIQNAFPVAYKNIDKPYLHFNVPLKITNQKDISEIKSKFDDMIELISKGYTFYPHQPNVIKLEKEIIEDVKFEKYVSSLKKENSNFKIPLPLDEPVLLLIKEYNKFFDTPKTLREIYKDFKLDNTKNIKNPLLQSIGAYFATGQENTITNSKEAISAQLEIAAHEQE